MANNKRALVILNPVAGSSDPEAFRRTLENVAASGPWQYDLYETKADDDVGEIVAGKIADGRYELVIAVGGDGTVSGVADGLVGSDVALGIVPAGTGNALAAELNIPMDTAAALQILHQATVQPLDVMQVGRRAFVLHVSAGIVSETMEITAPDEKQRLGILAYLKNGVRRLVASEGQRFTITLDGEKQELEAQALLVANAGAVGIGDLKWSRRSEPDDGRIELAVFQPQSALDYLRLVARIITGAPETAPNVQFLSAENTIEISAAEPVSVQGDGEPAGETPVSIEIYKHALHIALPA